MAITTDRLLAGVKRRITIPSNQALIQDSDILDIADDCIQEEILPTLISSQQNYYVQFEQQNLVSGQEYYSIPYRSSARGHRELKLSYDGTDTGVRDLTNIALEDKYKYARSGSPVGYVYEGDRIALVPVPNSDDMILYQWYILPPNRNVAVSEAARVTSIASNVVTVNLVPTTFTMSTELDFIQGKSGSRTLAFDKAITNIAGTQITFAVGDVPTDLEVGDYLALAGETPVVQIPNEAYPLLELVTAQEVLEAIGDFEGTQVLDDKVKRSRDAFLKLAQPRNPGAPQKIVPPANGLLRGRGLGYFNSRWWLY